MIKRAVLIAELQAADIEATVLGKAGNFSIVVEDSPTTHRRVRRVLERLGVDRVPKPTVEGLDLATYTLHRLKIGSLNPPCVHGKFASLMQVGDRTICTRCVREQDIADVAHRRMLGTENFKESQQAARVTKHVFLQSLRKVVNELTTRSPVGRLCWPDMSRPLMFYLHGIQVRIWPDWSLEHYYGSHFVHYTKTGKCQLKEEL